MWWNKFKLFQSSKRSSAPRRRTFRPMIESLEYRVVPTAPAAPVIIEPQTNGVVKSAFDVNMQTNPSLYSDADGDSWQATDWQIRNQSGGQVVWQTGFISTPSL